MSWDWDIKLDGASIRGKVSSFSLHKGRNTFCKELTLELKDYELYGSFDFTQIPEETRVEIFTEVDGNWQSEGIFFIEQPDVAQDKDNITVPSLWGRDNTARLTHPFAVRISKEWDEDTTLFAIVQEMLEECNLEYSAGRMLINDFAIYRNSYSVVNKYPLEVIQELIGKTDGFLYTDRLGQIWVLRDLYNWDAVTNEIHGGMIKSVTERVEFPEFANRVQVGSFARDGELNFNLSLSMSAASVAIGETITGRAVVTHNDGTPVADGHVVSWTTDNPTYATWQHSTTHTGTVHVENEAQTATSLRLISTTYPIRQIYSVTEVDTGETKEVSEFEGRSITLAEDLDFTNSAVLIDYEAGGIADNTLYPGTTGEVEVDVHAVVAVHIRDSATVRIDTSSGAETGEQAMYVTLVYKGFTGGEAIQGIIPIIDGASKTASDANGEVDLGLLAGGAHTHKVDDDNAAAAGYQGTEGDGLANDEFNCSTS